jgi:hypothetical protein
MVVVKLIFVGKIGCCAEMDHWGEMSHWSGMGRWGEMSRWGKWIVGGEMSRLG